ncbi:MAG TPA: NADH-quinone oxidoreductase subunit NuoK [Candidatus Polarisedimenticolaceae bacterium]|nr:NADH-quinone oxidoreductase subunit NuoK [Candidatus Polarisedimenticolaceae bacterium]
MTPARLFVLSFLVFSIGLYGVLARRHLIGLLLSLELMFNAGNLAAVSVAWSYGRTPGILLALFGIAVTVAEVALGLALFLLADRIRRTTNPDDLSLLRR